MTSDAASSRDARRRRFASKVGPHMQASDVRVVDVPARPGVGAHRSFLVTTACGREDVQTTLVTRDPSRVRCPDCLDAIGDSQ
jgi:hypothetical protein